MFYQNYSGNNATIRIKLLLTINSQQWQCIQFGVSSDKPSSFLIKMTSEVFQQYTAQYARCTSLSTEFFTQPKNELGRKFWSWHLISVTAKFYLHQQHDPISSVEKKLLIQVSSIVIVWKLIIILSFECSRLVLYQYSVESRNLRWRR